MPNWWENRPPGGGMPGAGKRPNNGNNGGNSGNNGSSGDSTTPAPDPTPPVPAPENLVYRFVAPAVKPATPDIIVFDDDIQPVEEITELLFQQIGGRELINLINKDIINSLNPGLSQIGNMFKINLQYNPQNLIPLFNPGNEIINSFSIKFNDYVPEFGEGTGPGGSIVYIDENGDLIINLVNINNNEKVEIQVLNSGTVFNDTIYSEAQE